MRQGLGFITTASNTEHVNYLEHAYYLAQSIKDTQVNNSISLIVDQNTEKYLDFKHKKIFDQIITLEIDQIQGKNYQLETEVWFKSPYKQTIKIEADMLMTSSIDHWWSILDEKDVVLTSKVMTYWGKEIKNRSQRQLFDQNQLPDVYNGLYYFRYSKQSQKFFQLVKDIFVNWNWFRDQYLINCRYEYPVSDEVFAIAAKIYGVENCTLAGTVPSFVHMKNVLQNLPNTDPWWKYVWFEKNQNQINVGFFAQTLPFHYNDKNFLRMIANEADY